MGIDLQIRGRYGGRAAIFAPHGRDFLSKVHAWWKRNHAGVLLPRNRFTGTWEDRPTLGLSLHHAAENVVFSVRSRGRIEVHAKTSTAGPGYHMYVCDALHALGEELGIRWDAPHDESFDEGLYFYTRNPSDVHEAMRSFIRTLAGHMLDEDLGDALQLSMPLEWRFVVPDADVLTPLGPRDRAWLEGAAADGARGIDIFPWWHRGAGAHYHLGRALVQMWSEVRWREPISEGEEETLVDVHRALAAAYRAEPRLTCPWREWSEIAAWLDLDQELAATIRDNAAKAAEGPRIGYRRHDVIASIADGWSVRVPGALNEEWDEGSWVARDEARAVRVTTFSAGGDAAATAVRQNEEIFAATQAQRVALANGSTAALYRARDDDPSWILQSMLAGGDTNLAFCTIAFDDDAQRDWAVATLESLRWAAPIEPQRVIVGDE